jgi:fumarate reductase subunit C
MFLGQNRNREFAKESESGDSYEYAMISFLNYEISVVLFLITAIFALIHAKTT